MNVSSGEFWGIPHEIWKNGSFNNNNNNHSDNIYNDLALDFVLVFLFFSLPLIIIVLIISLASIIVLYAT